MHHWLLFIIYLIPDVQVYFLICFIHLLMRILRNEVSKNICDMYSEQQTKQECIPVGCVPPTLYILGGVSDTDPPGQRPPWTETPCDRDLPWTETPVTETPLGQNPSPDRIPPLTETNLLPGQTDACENIALPQTSLAGGKKVRLRVISEYCSRTIDLMTTFAPSVSDSNFATNSINLLWTVYLSITRYL